MRDPALKLTTWDHATSPSTFFVIMSHHPWTMFWRPTKLKTMLHRRDHSSSLVSTLASGSSSSSFYLHDPVSTVDGGRTGRRSISATAALSDLFSATSATSASHVYPESSLPLPPEAADAAGSGNAISA